MKNYYHNSAKALMFLLCLSYFSFANAYDFSEANKDGKTIYYNVISESDKTCEVTVMKEKGSWGSNVNFLDYEGVINVPSYAKGYKVIQIGEKAFLCCKNVTSVTIPNTVTKIESFAFNWCKGLTSVIIGDSIISIGAWAFEDCSALASINLPNSLKTISSYAFWDCSGLESIEIPNSVTYIGYMAFSDCVGLTSVTIPKSVTSMGNNPFRACSNLTSIKVEEGNPNFNSNGNCNAIIETATNTLFAGCKNTVIPNYITTIGMNSFYGCTELSSIIIPNSVTKIDACAFYGCTGLTEMVIPTKVSAIGGAAFASCSNLTSVSIPESVTRIDYRAFENCTSLTSVIIPKSVSFIGQRAFSGCKGLTSVTSYVTNVFETENGAFYYCDNATLYVPKGLVDIYKSTADWNRFTNIQEIPNISLTLACTDLGKVIINDYIEFSNNIDETTVYGGAENVFTFVPDGSNRLGRVLINGLDVTKSVKNNQLSTTIMPNTKMMVVFSPNNSDVNGDGVVNIADVISIVNTILEQ